MKSLVLFLFAFTFSFTAPAKEKTWTCIDESGNEVFTIKAKWVYDFSNGLCRIKKYQLVDQRWKSAYGFINRKGEIVIPCVYEEAEDFECDVTWVKARGSETYTLIDKTGATIATKPYKKVGIIVPGYTDRLAVYNSSGAMGFIDQKGNEVVPCKYSGSTYFVEGLCCVARHGATEGNYGFIDVNGKEVIPLQYDQAGTASFYNGKSRAQVGGKTVLIDKTGKVVFKTKYRTFQGFRMGRAAVCTKANRTGWAFINWKDEIVFGGDYDHANSFTEDGYAIVEKNGLKGLVDTNGKFVLPMKYETIWADYKKSGYYCGTYPAEGDSYVSFNDKKKDYFLKNLKPLAMKVKSLGNANGGDILLFRTTDGKIGYMNREGKVLIPAKTYISAEGFYEGLAWIRK